jgi:cytochrome c2
MPARKCSRNAPPATLVGEGAKHKVGPELNEIFGRTAGSAEGYKYSKAMIEAGEGGLVWDDATLARVSGQSEGHDQGHQDGLCRPEEG